MPMIPPLTGNQRKRDRTFRTASQGRRGTPSDCCGGPVPKKGMIIYFIVIYTTALTPEILRRTGRLSSSFSPTR